MISSVATPMTGAGRYGASLAGGAGKGSAAQGGSASSGAPTPAMLAAKQRLAKANAIVDADKAAHSPSCVACDQKLVVQAQLALTQATSAASAGSRLDISA